MYEHVTNLRVRYVEVDSMGYVYHGNYASYYEVGRTELMRNLGSSYKKLEDEGVLMPVIHLECHYIGQLGMTIKNCYPNSKIYTYSNHFLL